MVDDGESVIAHLEAFDVFFIFEIDEVSFVKIKEGEVAEGNLHLRVVCFEMSFSVRDVGDFSGVTVRSVRKEDDITVGVLHALGAIGGSCPR